MRKLSWLFTFECTQSSYWRKLISIGIHTVQLLSSLTLGRMCLLWAQDNLWFGCTYTNLAWGMCDSECLWKPTLHGKSPEWSGRMDGYSWELYDTNLHFLKVPSFKIFTPNSTKGSALGPNLTPPSCSRSILFSFRISSTCMFEW